MKKYLEVLQILILIKMKKLFKILSVLSLVFLGLNKTVSAQTTFVYTGSMQTYTIPSGIYSVSIDARGAQGGLGSLGAASPVGRGGRVQGILPVVPGQVLNIFVGGCGQAGSGAGATGGWNGGGAGVSYAGVWSGGGGGGATDVRIGGTALTNRVLVAAGGGGTGYWTLNRCGGDGGGLVGSVGCTSGTGVPGGGGTQVTGGGGGSFSPYTVGVAGALGVGGSSALSGTLYISGGGGGGYYGGGGGCCSGGGGGSSYTDPSVTSVTHTAGANAACGTITITNICVPPTGGFIVGLPNTCPGQSISLADIGGSPGGTWISSNVAMATVNSTTGVVTGVAPGSATITYNVVYPCGTASATTVITINPNPEPITDVTTLCQGSSLTANDATPGGEWSSSASPIAMVIPSSGLVIGVSAGSAIITYALTTTTGCYITTSVEIIALPIPITGPTSVCMGSTISLIEGSVGGTWTSSDTSVARIGLVNGVVTPVRTGTIDINYTNGCGTDVGYTVTVNPLPRSIYGNRYACVGYTTTLYDSTSGGNWSSFATGVATVDPSTGVVTGVSAGLNRITYTLPTGCYTTATISITPVPTSITGASTICAGSTTPLTVTLLGGVWTSSASSLATVGTTGIVTGMSMGGVNISYTIGTGCSTIKAMTVNPIAPIAGRDTICLGGVGYKTDIVGGGTWRSSNTTVATISIDSGLVDGLTIGTTIITYTLPSGCKSKDTIRVIANPPAILGTNHLCVGATTSLTNADFWGSWSSSNNSVATVNTAGIVTGLNSDTVTIYFTINPGCRVSMPVTVNPLPLPITGKTIDCPGVLDTLYDASIGGTWSSLTPSIATITSTTGIVSTLSGGTATFKYTLPTGCSTTKSLNVRSGPTPNVTYNWYSQTLYCDTPYVNYQWYDSIMGKIPGANSPSLAALYNEYYYVVVTDINGCKGASAWFHFDIRQVGVNNVNAPKFNIYPNPTTGKLYIDCAVKVRAIVNDIAGRTILDQADAHSLDIGNLPDGTYLMTLYDEAGEVITVQKMEKN